MGSLIFFLRPEKVFFSRRHKKIRFLVTSVTSPYKNSSPAGFFFYGFGAGQWPKPLGRESVTWKIRLLTSETKTKASRCLESPWAAAFTVTFTTLRPESTWRDHRKGLQTAGWPGAPAEWRSVDTKNTFHAFSLGGNLGKFQSSAQPSIGLTTNTHSLSRTSGQLSW